MTHTAYIEAECGIFGNQTLKVEYSYYPEEPSTRECLGSYEEYEITSVWIVLPPESQTKIVPEVLIDVTNLNNIDDQAIIDLIREVE